MAWEVNANGSRYPMSPTRRTSPGGPVPSTILGGARMTRPRDVFRTPQRGDGRGAGNVSNLCAGNSRGTAVYRGPARTAASALFHRGTNPTPRTDKGCFRGAQCNRDVNRGSHGCDAENGPACRAAAKDDHDDPHSYGHRIIGLLMRRCSKPAAQMPVRDSPTRESSSSGEETPIQEVP